MGVLLVQIGIIMVETVLARTKVPEVLLEVDILQIAAKGRLCISWTTSWTEQFVKRSRLHIHVERNSIVDYPCICGLLSMFFSLKLPLVCSEWNDFGFVATCKPLGLLGSMNPAMPSSFSGSNLVYEYMNPGESLSRGQALNSTLPDRPGQPESSRLKEKATVDQKHG
ncbi:hypothetical protein OROGR_020522 [Orobanche gracilis]